MNSFQQPWRAWLYRKEKTVKKLCGDVYSLHITHRRSLLATSGGDRQGADSRRLLYFFPSLEILASVGYNL